MTDLEQVMGRDLGESDQDMKLAIGYQFLHGRFNEGMEDARTGGGDITMATIMPDRSISMQILATADECMASARPYFDGKTDTRPKPRGMSRPPEMALERWAEMRNALAGAGKNINGAVENEHVALFDHTA